MKGWLALIFPYLCALTVVGLIFFGNVSTSVTTTASMVDLPDMPEDSTGAHKDMVCGMEVGDEIATQLQDATFYFCTDFCRQLFEKDPAKFFAETCVVCKADGEYTEVSEKDGLETTWQGKTYLFCSIEHRNAFREDPAGYFMHTMWGIPNWLYYTSIAFVLVVSFGVIELVSKWQKDGVARNRPRINLTRSAIARRIIKSPFPRFAAQAIIVTLFIMIVAAGLFGNQHPAKNVAPLLTWTIWWGGLIWLVLYAGKLWCYVCPWDAISDWAEGLRFWGKKKNTMGLKLKWPKFMANIWPATILFVGLTWIELGFGVTMKPRATAWLALAMLGMTFASIFIFDRKSFCRYGCLVGRISGLYALFAPIEVRAQDPDECKSCTTNSCFKGNADGEACPTFLSLRTMSQSTYCISCMECFKTCEKDNVALRLRPWGEDLATGFKPRSDEAYLALLMLSLTGFHGLTMTGSWQKVLNWIEGTFNVGMTAAFSLGMAALMVAPAVVYALLVALSKLLAGKAVETTYRQYFIRYAYALLPIALFYHIAHNSEHFLMEGQKVIALLSDPLGREWNLFGTAKWILPPLVNLPTLWIIQVMFVMIGHVYSLWVARRVATGLFDDPKAATRSQVPMLIAMILFSIMSLWLLKQPMEMRTSSM